MVYELLAGDDCDDDDICPSIRRGDAGFVIVTGTEITDPAALIQLHVGPGERAVMIEEAMLRTAVSSLKGRA